jgi:outer membrane protein OmpA-like peptidoglycan-associated protein
MEKIIKGFYRSSFSTTALESKNRDVTYHGIKLEGRKTLEKTEEISEFPSEDYFSKLDIVAIANVELYPKIDSNSFDPFNTNLYDVKWTNIKVSSEHEIDGVLHGIIEAELHAKYNREKNAQQSHLNTPPLADNQINSQEQISLDDSTQLDQNKGCFIKPKSGCLSILLWLFLILLVLFLFRKCSENDIVKTDNTDNTDNSNNTDNTNPLDTLKLKQEGKDSVIIEHDLVEIVKTVSLPNVQFFTNSDQLLPTSKQDLDGLTKYLLENLNAKAQIIGHTDNVGGMDKNMKLSFSRAMSVKNYLTQKGVGSDRIEAIGKGPTEPRASNDTPEGRLMNRRVEVKISQQTRS